MSLPFTLKSFLVGLKTGIMVKSRTNPGVNWGFLCPQTILTDCEINRVQIPRTSNSCLGISKDPLDQFDSVKVNYVIRYTDNGKEFGMFAKTDTDRWFKSGYRKRVIRS